MQITDIKVPKIRDSHARRALQFKNKIISKLVSIGLDEDEIEFEYENVAIKRSPASVSFYVGDDFQFYGYGKGNNFAENIAVVCGVVTRAVDAFQAEEISVDQFIEIFKEDENVVEDRKNARKVLGFEPNERDFDKIHTEYKKLAKAHHPDVDGGCVEKFKEINKAHKVLKKELQ